MTKEELAEIKARAERVYGFYPLTPITTNTLCDDIFALVKEVERLQSKVEKLQVIAEEFNNLVLKSIGTSKQAIAELWKSL